jgi:hypothetical protein
VKDATGRTFGPGDYIVYAVRRGSNIAFKFGKVLALGQRNTYAGPYDTMLVQGAERGYMSGAYMLQPKRSTLTRGDTAVIVRRDQLDLALVKLLDVEALR